MQGHAQLQRRLRLPGAIFIGLGSILGTGVFVSIAIAAGITGPSVVLAIVLAAAVAACSALSSAQLAASHPVSGGTYEYGYVYLTPWLGFTAGWMFLCAKTASAASAALGFSGYLLRVVDGEKMTPLVPVAVGAVAALTLVAVLDIQRSSRFNAVITTITMAALGLFVVVGAAHVAGHRSFDLTPFFHAGGAVPRARGFLEATALVFVAFTGYGRVATLGEEAVDPRRTIPRAIVSVLVISAIVYIAVGAVLVATTEVSTLGAMTTRGVAPLQQASEAFGYEWVPALIGLGAMTAMLGVLLNLIIGLSRVLLAMARRADAPPILARLNAGNTSPYIAVIAVGVAVAALAGIGNIKTTWSFSAFTVLVYYGITNAAALRLPADARMYPRCIALAGLLSTLALAFFVEPRIWMTGLAVLGAGAAWFILNRRLRSTSRA